MTATRIAFCNRTYAGRWLRNLRRQCPRHFDVLRALLKEIDVKDGGDISRADLFERFPAVRDAVRELGFDPVPSRGQMLKHNGDRIRHAKFSPSKSVAVLWQRIGDVVHVTFDDHAQFGYHRAISHFRALELGLPVFPRSPRSRIWFYKLLTRSMREGHLRRLKGFSARRRHYGTPPLPDEPEERVWKRERGAVRMVGHDPERFGRISRHDDLVPPAMDAGDGGVVPD